MSTPRPSAAAQDERAPGSAAASLAAHGDPAAAPDDPAAAPDDGASGCDVPDEAVQAAVDEAVRRVDALVAADPDLVHGDAVEAVALECPVDVAVLLCQQTMRFVPDTIRQRVFEAEHADAYARSGQARVEREAAEERARSRNEKAAATRAAARQSEAAEASAALRSATCPSCFQLRSASGVCGCD